MLVCANHSQLVDDLAAAVGASHGACYKILTDHLNMSCVTQHAVPLILLQTHIMLELFSDPNGIVHMEIIPEGETVNKTCYKEILSHLRNSIHSKQPGLWRT